MVASRLSAGKLRRLRRHIGLMRCEWCGRFCALDDAALWPADAVGDWAEYLAENPVFVCRRPLCQQHHRESGGLHPTRGRWAPTRQNADQPATS